MALGTFERRERDAQRQRLSDDAIVESLIFELTSRLPAEIAGEDIEFFDDAAAVTAATIGGTSATAFHFDVAGRTVKVAIQVMERRPHGYSH